MPANATTVRFGVFEVDLRSGELRRNGVRVRLQEQPFQILVALLERPGEVVTREELRGRLWPADTFVGFEHSLNAAVKRLREALGDSAENPRFIETLPRHGYRLVAPVERPEPASLAPVPPARRRFARSTAWALGAVLALVVVGRVVSLRPMGSAFVHIEDGTGKIQLFFNKKNVGEEAHKLFIKNIELGDFIQAKGKMFKTKTEEKSLQVIEWKVLSKTLESFPTEYFGFKNEEEKFRKRYLDLFFNREEREIFMRRAKFWRAIRNFMVDKGFLEVETPSIETTTGGAAARPFRTHHNDFDMPVYMRICVGELWQKRLMAAGFEKTFEVGRAFSVFW